MPSNQTKVIKNARIFDGREFIQGHHLVIKDEVIADIVPSYDDPGAEIIDLKGKTISAGFIDIQVNGGGGVQFNDAINQDAIRTIIKAHLSSGITGVMITLITDDVLKLRQCFKLIASLDPFEHPHLIGFHFEGFSISPQKSGIHPKEHIISLSDEIIDDFLNLPPHFKYMITIAPEETDLNHIKILSDAGITMMAGHTNATPDCLISAKKAGIKGVTHLYNAMSGLKAREPGVIGAALFDPDLYCSLIADGHHVDPLLIRAAFQVKPKGKLLLTSDAMALAASDRTVYKSQAFSLYKQGLKCIGTEGELAGSAVTLKDCVDYCHKTLGLDLKDCLNAASLYCAELLGLKDRGALRVGYRADYVVID